MKKFIYAALSFAIATNACAGNFSWEISNSSSAISNDELNSIVRKAISSSDATSDLRKPWFLNVIVSGGGTNINDIRPGLIMVEKAKKAGKDGYVIKCRKFWYGTFSKPDMESRLYDQVQASLGYVTSHQECI